MLRTICISILAFTALTSFSQTVTTEKRWAEWGCQNIEWNNKNTSKDTIDIMVYAKRNDGTWASYIKTAILPGESTGWMQTNGCKEKKSTGELCVLTRVTKSKVVFPTAKEVELNGCKRE